MVKTALTVTYQGCLAVTDEELKQIAIRLPGTLFAERARLTLACRAFGRELRKTLIWRLYEQMIAFLARKL